ncbi:hypothetical protein ES674_11660 [Bizionia myxarmorum]|uniref:Uncharacterized protein n=1 Tax=Bizionia myxarmorum TaxID=291186 RepID=A0A5D0R442_9FLAO|nr:hypothetical protein ES674_11660 [Bizionia myxarmorum]
MKKSRSEFQNTDKSVIILGSIIATFIAITPYLFYLYESVPSEKTWDTFMFTYESIGYGDANIVMWLLTGKLIPLLFLLIWFFTCRHWWYHTLLVPISMYIYQIIGLFNEDQSYVDELQLIYLVPVMAIIVPSIYLVRAKMLNKINNANKSLQQLEDEFMLTPTSFWGKLKQYF